MKVVGLTGSIGMGKSTVAGFFREAGVPVFDADAAVHALYGEGGAAVAAIGGRFAGAVDGGRVDRAVLSRLVLGDSAALRDLEAIVHPLVAEARQRFLAEMSARGEALVVVEVPLLLETGGADKVDVVVVVSADPKTQRARVLAREGMTEQKFAAIRARQMSEADKRRRADHVIVTDRPLEKTRGEVMALVKRLRKANPSDGG